MTGPEHYKNAEGCLYEADRIGESYHEERAYWLARGQVHATLAHVAATVDLFALYGQVGDESKDAWRKAVTG